MDKLPDFSNIDDILDTLPDTHSKLPLLSEIEIRHAYEYLRRVNPNITQRINQTRLKVSDDTFEELEIPHDRELSLTPLQLHSVIARAAIAGAVEIMYALAVSQQEARMLDSQVFGESGSLE